MWGVKAHAHTTTPLELLNGARAWGSPYATPAATRDDPIVVLHGVVHTTKRGKIARLPRNMRPSRTLVFSQNKGEGTLQIAVDNAGYIKVKDGGAPLGNWVSLDGITFSTREAERLSLGSGFRNWENGYGDLRAYKHRDLVVLMGLVHAPAGRGRITTLPAQLRPKERLMFQVAGVDGPLRVHVEINGEVHLHTADHGGRVNLSGVVFPTKQGKLLPLGPGVNPYRNVGFGPPRVFMAGPFAVLTGMVTNANSEETLFTLPRELRTASMRILNGYSGDRTARLDLFTEGGLQFSEGGVEGSWLTVSGLVLLPGGEAPVVEGTKPLELLYGDKRWGRPYGTPSATADPPIVVLHGMTRTTRLSAIAQLPLGMRPLKKQIFSRPQGADIVQLEIRPNGHIVAREDYPITRGRISFDGLTFSTRDAERLTPASGFSHFGQNYGDLRAYKHRNLVVLSGMVRGRRGRGRITTLPNHLRPAERLMFQVAIQNGQGRVDIQPNGEVFLHTPDHGGWISLAGIAFPTGKGSAMALNGAVPYGSDGFGPPRATNVGPFTVLTGLITNAPRATFLTLPRGSGPASAHTFSSHSDSKSARLELKGNGQLSFAEGGTVASWLTLTGVIFPTGDGGGSPSVGQPSPPVGGNPPATGNNPDKQIVSQARQAVGSNNQGLVHNALDNLADATLDKRTEAGVTWYQKNLRLLGANFQLVLYWPTLDGQKKNQPNIALLPQDAKFDLSTLLTEVPYLNELGDVKVQHTVFLWVPFDNAHSAVAMSGLPTPIRTRIQQVDTRQTLAMVGGQNVFGRVSLGAGDLRSALTSIGFCNGDCGVRVHAAHGKAAADDCNPRPRKTWWVRLSRQRWSNIFTIDGLTMTEPVVEIRSTQGGARGVKKVLKAWARKTTVTYQGESKDYFLYAQCTLKTCKVDNAFAFNAAEVSLDDYRRLVQVIGRAVLGATFEDMTGVFNNVPLDAVSVKGLSYDSEANLDVAGRPDLSQMMGFFIGKNQQILASKAVRESANKCVKGKRVMARGTGVVLGKTVGDLTVEYWQTGHSGQKKKGRQARGIYADVDLSGWSDYLDAAGVLLVSTVKKGNSTQGKMAIKAEVSIPPISFEEDVEIELSKRHIDFRLDANCPYRPIGVRFRANSLNLSSGLNVSWNANSTLDCLGPLGPIVEAFAEGAEVAFGVAASSAELAHDMAKGLGGYFPKVREQLLKSYGSTSLGNLNPEGVRSQVHGALKHTGYSMVYDNKVFGAVAKDAIKPFSDIKDKFPTGTTSGMFYADPNKPAKLLHKVVDEVSSWFKSARRLKTGPSAPTRLESNPNQPISCKGSHVEWGGRERQDLILATPYIRNKTRSSGGIQSTQRFAECPEVGFRPDRDGAWWRVDLGKPYEVSAVVIQNASGTGQRHGGLEGALVVLSTQDDLKAALSEDDVYFGDDMKYQRRHQLGAGNYHVIAPRGACTAQLLATVSQPEEGEADFDNPDTQTFVPSDATELSAPTPEAAFDLISPQDKPFAHLSQNVYFRSISSTRYVWIYQRGRVPLNLSRVQVFGTEERISARDYIDGRCDCMRCTPGKGVPCNTNICWDESH
ncbi:MAG: discoidin domain-containing protein [Bradymonadia bacterium]